MMEVTWLDTVLYSAGLFLASAGGLWFLIRPKHVDTSVPGPLRHPLFGLMMEKDSKMTEDGDVFDWDLWPTLSLRLSQKYGFRTWGGPTLNIGFGGAFLIVVSSASFGHVVRDNHTNYHKGKLVKAFHELLGQTAFSTDGDAWKFHRKVAVSILSKETVQIAAKLMYAKLQQVEETVLHDKETVIDIQDLAFRTTLDVLGKLGFGVELNSIQSNQHVPFVEAFNELQALIHKRFDDLLWEWKQYFGIGEREKRIREVTKIVRKFAEDIIEATKKSEYSESRDIVGRYLHYCQKQNEPMPSNEELRDIVLSFVMAGRDTTSAAMSWTMYELMRHPALVDRIRQEMVDVLGGKPPSTMEEVRQLTYLQAVIMEALRLHPPAPDSFRFAKRDDTLPDGTRIPAGALVQFSLHCINHNDNIWKDVDPQVFQPDRFYGKGQPNPCEFASFSAGPRTCPGRGLATMEIGMFLAYLLSKYDFEEADEKSKHNGDYKFAIVMSMKNGFRLRVRKRQES